MIGGTTPGSESAFRRSPGAIGIGGSFEARRAVLGGPQFHPGPLRPFQVRAVRSVTSVTSGTLLMRMGTWMVPIPAFVYNVRRSILYKPRG